MTLLDNNSWVHKCVQYNVLLQVVQHILCPPERLVTIAPFKGKLAIFCKIKDMHSRVRHDMIQILDINYIQQSK